MKWSSTNKVSPGHALSQVWFLLLQVHMEEQAAGNYMLIEHQEACGYAFWMHSVSRQYL